MYSGMISRWLRRCGLVPVRVPVAVLVPIRMSVVALALALVPVAILATAPAGIVRAQEDDGATLDVVEVRSDTFPRIVVRLNTVPGTRMQATGLAAEQFRVFE